MTTPAVRTDVNAAAITLLLNVHRSDLPIVVRESGGGSPQEVEAAITAQVQREHRENRLEGIPVPEELERPEERSAWKAAVRGAAEKVREASAPNISLDEALPELMTEKKARAEEAGSSSPEVSTRLAQIGQEIRDHAERRELRLSEKESSLSLAAKLGTWEKAERFLWGLEALAIFGASASYFGVLEAPSLTSVPVTTWLQVFALCLPCTVSTFVLAMAVTYIVRRFASTRLLMTIGAIVALAATLVFGIALGVLRWAAALSGDQVDEGSAALGSGALLVIVAITSIVVAGAAVAARMKTDTLRKAVEEAQREDGLFHSGEERLAHERDHLQRHLSSLDFDMRRPSELRSLFERSVKLVLERMREEQDTLRDRVTQGISAHRYLSRLSAPMREAILGELYEITPPSQEKPSETPLPAKAASRIKRTIGFLSVLLAVVLTGSVSTACGRQPTAENLIIGCDTTGTAQGEVCTSELLLQAFIPWAAEAIGSPGSLFQVMGSGGSYGDTAVFEPVIVPSKWTGDAKMARQGWRRQSLEVVAALKLPSGSEVRKNRSDLISLLLLASSKARETKDAKTRLLLASDGLLISAGFDAEKEMPRSEEVLLRMKARNLSLDLSVFESITVCGFHNKGISALKAQARERFWKQFIAETGGKAPEIRGSCRALFPPVSPALLPTEATTIAGSAN